MGYTLNEQLTDITICPRCSAPSAIYRYSISSERSNEGVYVRIVYSMKCDICGYSESMRGSMPLSVAYKLRHLFIPRVKIALEKTYLLAEKLEKRA
ncbi:hypothetical protein APE_0116a [Aeropyrum pernix K1]|uniref:Uncharacterized protein n=1 Tax=Aeropyrum pernix (strain ATCC 700893 / DSM 11879 / JCM 9820 / NBRC 100138 / K1) TaxID=272557 RepID=Q05E91_AERPE|nr:hypothetical protein APE_0116a [Aeropyrum pernix K1]